MSLYIFLCMYDVKVLLVNLSTKQIKNTQHVSKINASCIGNVTSSHFMTRVIGQHSE